MKLFLFPLILSAFTQLTTFFANAEALNIEYKASHLELSLLDSFLEEKSVKHFQSFLRNNGECLMPNRRTELNQIVIEIEELYDGVTKILKKGSGLTMDESVKDRLIQKSSIFETAKEDILSKIDLIKNEACFSCADISGVVNDAVQEIFTILADLDPNLGTSPWFDTIVTFSNALSLLVKDLCGSTNGMIIQDDTHGYLIYQMNSEFSFNAMLQRKEQCLTQAQEDDVEEVIQLAGNVLNTFAEWLKESEEKAKSKELKYVLSKLSTLLSKERELIDHHGVAIVEKVCEECGVVIHFVSKIVNFAEKMLKTFVPFWRSIPKLELIVNTIDDLLSQAKEACPYEYKRAQLFRFESSYNIRATNSRYLSTQLENFLDSLVYALEEHAQGQQALGHSLYERFSFAEVALDIQVIKQKYSDLKPELSCKDVFDRISNVLNKIEQLLDNKIPLWRDLPFVETVDNFLHLVLAEIQEFCPNSVEYLEFFKSSLEKNCISNIGKNSFPTDFVSAVDSVLNRASSAPDGFDQNLFKAFQDFVYGSRMAFDRSSNIISSESCNICSTLVHEGGATLGYLTNYAEKQAVDSQNMNIANKMIRDVEFINSRLRLFCTPSDEVNPMVRDSACVFKSQDLETLSKEMSQQVSTIVRKYGPQNNLRLGKVSLFLNTHLTEKNLCLSCSEVVEAIEKLISEIEGVLSEILPGWDNLPLVSEVDNLIHNILDSISKRCPSLQKTRYISGRVQPQMINLEASKEHCLSEDQRERFGNITEQLKVGIDIVANIVDLRAQFEPNPMKKFTLEETSRVLRVVGKDVVLNLTSLADEFCGDCKDLVHAAKDSIIVLEEALFDVNPLWRKTALYNGIKEVTDNVFEELQSFCKTTSSRNVQETDGCLTPEQSETLKRYVSSIDGFMTYAAETLEAYANDVAQGEFQEELLQVAKALKAIDRDLVKNITKIADESCGTCLNIVGAMKDFETAVESAMTDIDPNWRTNQKYNSVAVAVNTVISLIERLCPMLAAPPCEHTLTEAKFLNKVQELKLIADFFTAHAKQQVPSSSYKFGCPDREDVLIWSLQPHLATKEIDEKYIFANAILVALSHIETVFEEKVVAETRLLQKRQITVLRDTFSLLKQDLNENIMAVQENLNFGCDNLVEIVQESLNEVESFVKQMIPLIGNSGIFKATVDVLDALLKSLREFCPNQEIESTVQSFKTIES